jgi:hypothetical protein
MEDNKCNRDCANCVCAVERVIQRPHSSEVEEFVETEFTFDKEVNIVPEELEDFKGI